MKLVEILAREMERWPQGAHSVGQAIDGSLHKNGKRNEYLGHTIKCYSLTKTGNFHRGKVTRADWETEHAKLKAPKANGDGWVRHRGRKCPVPAGTRVSTKHRDGKIVDVHHLTAEPNASDVSLREVWSHRGDEFDIMAYRIHKPAEQADEHDLTRAPKPAPSLSQRADTMLAIRDRIRELDAKRAEVESTYQRQINEITQERESLVQRLAGEGFSLIGDKPGTLLTWQRYAKDGMKINAIKEYRELTGVGLREAKEAVEAYQDSLD